MNVEHKLIRRTASWEWQNSETQGGTLHCIQSKNMIEVTNQNRNGCIPLSWRIVSLPHFFISTWWCTEWPCRLTHQLSDVGRLLQSNQLIGCSVIYSYNRIKFCLRKRLLVWKWAPISYFFLSNTCEYGLSIPATRPTPKKMTVRFTKIVTIRFREGFLRPRRFHVTCWKQR